METLNTGKLGKLRVYHSDSWKEYTRCTLDESVLSFQSMAEGILTRWIQTHKGVVILLMIPDCPDSGTIYFFNRIQEDWYMLYFDGCENSFTREVFDRTFREYDLFRFIEKPELLLELMAY